MLASAGRFLFLVLVLWPDLTNGQGRAIFKRPGVGENHAEPLSNRFTD